MEIRTQRLLLRPIGANDLATTQEYASDPENCRYMIFLPSDSEQGTLSYLKDAENEMKKPSPDYYEMAVIYENRHIGCVSLYLNDTHDSAEIGYTINKRWWRQGFGYEAASALIGYARQELGLRHFVAHCDKENTGSRRIMEKLGMVRTDEHGGRKNKLSDEERREYVYELEL